MDNIKNISENYKILAVCAIIGFVLSFLIGLVFGTGILSMVIRSFLMALMFLAVGFVVLLVLNIFVPEVYEIITQQNVHATAGTDGTETGLEENSEFPEMDGADGSLLEDNDHDLSDKPDGKDFKEVNVDEMSNVKSDLKSGDSELNTTLSAAENGNMGKHIVVNDNNIEYEPKLMAQAVRTMLSKDEQ